MPQDNPPLLGQILDGRYLIEQQLGKGGIGAVYLAQDRKLYDKPVVVKVLLENALQNGWVVQKFQQEKEALARVDHPGVVGILDTGELPDQKPYIVMQYIDGVPLREAIKAKPEGMDLARVASIIKQSGAALNAVHQKKIYHRDLKPENIMLQALGRGHEQVKIVDFGIAKLKESVIAPGTTTGGATAGTLVYMSPEQLSGEKITAASDIYSLAVIAYEMVTGRRPFNPDSIAHLAEMQRQGVRVKPVDLRPRLPEKAQAILLKALAYDREERHQNAGEFGDALASALMNEESKLMERIPSATLSEPTRLDSESRSTLRLAISASPHFRRGALIVLSALVVVAAYFYFFTRPVEAINSIAVLPFVSSGNDPNIEYLSDGITESTINSLSNLPNLKVIARNSVFQYKGKEINPQAAGRDLNVQAVLMGRVVQHNDSLSISVELIDVRNNHHLWGEQYKKKVSDILAVQDEISREISEKLRLKLTSEDQRRLTKRYTENTEAYRLYWNGRYHWNKRTDEGLKKAIEFFEQAIELDPSYALAYAGLADSYNLLVVYDVFSSREAFPRAKAAAKKALEIDETLAEAHTSLAYTSMYYDWDWAGAEREYKRAIELNPNYATAHHWYGEYLTLVGRHDEGMAEIRRALELDPLSLIINTYVGWGLVCAREYNEGIKQMRKVLEMDRGFVTGHYFLAWAYEQNRQFPDAIAEYQTARDLSGNSTAVIAALGHAYAMAGNMGAAQKVLDELKKLSKDRYVSPFSMALIYAGLGDKDQAFTWLQVAYEQRAQLMALLKVDPRFDNLRSDRRFAELMQRMDLALQ